VVHIIQQRPSVFLVGYTQPVHGEVARYMAHRGVEWNSPDHLTNDPLAIVEMAGRVCYHSWHNPANKTREDYIKTSIIEQEHGSVLEHVWFNMLVADLPRSAQLELVRHGEGTGFSFESQRFTDTHLRFVVPPRLREDADAVAIFTEAAKLSEVYYRMLQEMSGSDSDTGTLTRKRKKEAARALLLGSAGSDGMVSMNGRAARHIINLRTNEHADLSIREFAWEVYRSIHGVAPALFSDATVKYDTADAIPVVSFEHPKV
jgi:thymidylate synthase (FAD)